MTVSDMLLLGFREYLIGRALPTRCAGKNVGAIDDTVRNGPLLRGGYDPETLEGPA